MSQRILLVDDDKHLTEVLAFSLREKDHEVVVVHSVDDALKKIEESAAFSVIMTDLRMPGRSGLDLVKAVCSDAVHPPIIVLTAHGSMEIAVDAMREGAADFLTKPVSRDILQMTLLRVTQNAALQKENETLKSRLDVLSTSGGMIAESEEMKDCIKLVDRVAASMATVMIRGESGTGKELIAKRLHERSERRGPFVALNCAALPRELLESELFGHAKGAFTGALKAREGRFVQAHGGTLFLDEVGDLDLELQAKLLRVLQDGVVDVVGGGSQKVETRIVVATHQNLEQMVREGKFREDLYFRIRVIPVEVPPLRQRVKDIPLLFSFFVARAAAKSARPIPIIDKDLLTTLSARSWPGNVRELENTATRLCITAAPNEALTADMLLQQDGRLDLRADVQSEGRDVLTFPKTGIDLEATERALFLAALVTSEGNRSLAARLLNVPRHVLLYRLGKYGIVDDDIARASAQFILVTPTPKT